jgi:hypothetical protein
VGGRVVGLEPNGLSVLHDRGVGLARVEVGAREAEADDGIVRHDLDHLLELLDPIRIRHQGLRAAASGQRGSRSSNLGRMIEAEALAALRGPDPVLAARAEATLWEIWCRSGLPEVDRLLRQGIEAMERHELEDAVAVFTRIIERAPTSPKDGTSGAALRGGGHPGAVADCEETVARTRTISARWPARDSVTRRSPVPGGGGAVGGLTVHPHLTSANHNSRRLSRRSGQRTLARTTINGLGRDRTGGATDASRVLR